MGKGPPEREGKIQTAALISRGFSHGHPETRPSGGGGWPVYRNPVKHTGRQGGVPDTPPLGRQGSSGTKADSRVRVRARGVSCLQVSLLISTLDTK